MLRAVGRVAQQGVHNSATPIALALHDTRVFALRRHARNPSGGADARSVARNALVLNCTRAGRQRCVRAMATSNNDNTEVATLGGGCFWCVEGCFQLVRGVTSVVSGYAGGHVDNPTYEQVCGKKTGHAEVVQVAFDPSIVSYKELLQMFFTAHDPTTKDRQGNDEGPQYRSIILYSSDEQKQIAEEVMAQVTSEGWWGAPLVTELVPLTKFWPGEEYHQNYAELNPQNRYCQFVVQPKIAKFRQKYGAKLYK